ncbi:hypothetical protein SLA2020_074770 [Shorea laevis]
MGWDGAVIVGARRLSLSLTASLLNWREKERKGGGGWDTFGGEVGFVWTFGEKKDKPTFFPFLINKTERDCSLSSLSLSAFFFLLSPNSSAVNHSPTNQYHIHFTPPATKLKASNTILVLSRNITGLLKWYISSKICGLFNTFGSVCQFVSFLF